MESVLCKRPVRWSPGCCVAVRACSVGLALVMNGWSHQILGWYLLRCGGETALMPAGTGAVGRPIAPQALQVGTALYVGRGGSGHCGGGEGGVAPECRLTAI